MALNYDDSTQYWNNGLVYVKVTDVVNGLYRFANFTKAACRKACERFAEEIVPIMQANAPWEDRTGEARANLRADVVEDTVYRSKDFEVGVTLSHGVSYGVFLEYNGIYTPSYLPRQRPILVPTMESEEAQILLEELQEQFSKISRV